MRLFVATVVFAFLAMPVASAQWLSDPAGDASVANAPFAPEHTDLIALEVTEDETTLGLEAEVAAGEGGSAEAFATVHRVFFQFRDTLFRVDVQGQASVDAGGNTGFQATGALLQRRDGGEWTTVRSLVPVTREDAPGWAVQVERSELLDSDGVVPGAGHSLEGWYVESYWAPQETGDELVDRMPDAGVGESFPIEKGLRQDGDARLVSERPFRSSNGEATQYRFDLLLENNGEQETTYRLQALDVPSGWDILALPDEISVPAASNETFSLVADVPFLHAHGERESFQLEAHDEGDPGNVGRIHLGVLYLDPPQPAGHHDELFFHVLPVSLSPAQQTQSDVNQVLFGAGSDTVLVMNAGFEDERAVESDQPGDADMDGIWMVDDPSSFRFTWSAKLDPGLRIGLNVSGDKGGSLIVPLHAQMDHADARMEGELILHLADGPGQVLATFQGPELGALSAGDHQLEASMNDVNPGQYPWMPGHQLHLNLTLHTSTPTGPQGESLPPSISPGGSIRLPLEEWTDGLSGIRTTTVTSTAGAPSSEEPSSREAPSAGGPLLFTGILGVAVVHRRCRRR